MAQVSGALCLSHSPYLYTPPELWTKALAKKSFREDVPRDSHETNVVKYNRCVKALETRNWMPRQGLWTAAPGWWWTTCLFMRHHAVWGLHTGTKSIKWASRM